MTGVVSQINPLVEGREFTSCFGRARRAFVGAFSGHDAIDEGGLALEDGAAVDEQAREVARAEGAGSDGGDEGVPELEGEGAEAGDVARGGFGERVPHHAQEARPHPRVVLGGEVRGVAFGGGGGREEDGGRVAGEDGDGFVARVRGEVQAGGAGGVEEAGAWDGDYEDGAEVGNADVFGEAGEGGEEGGGAFALLVDAVEDKDELVLGVEETMEVDEEGAEVLAAGVRGAVEWGVGRGCVNGVEAGGEGALEEVATGDAFSGLYDGVGNVAGLEDAPDYGGFGGGIKAVDNEGGRAGERRLLSRLA